MKLQKIQNTIVFIQIKENSVKNYKSLHIKNINNKITNDNPFKK